MSHPKVNVVFSQPDMGGAPETVLTFARAAEDLGFDGLAVADHVIGANTASRPDWGNRNTSKDFFHDPFVLFGFLAASTSRVELSTQVLILAQRQTALVAKQAASAAVLAGGRLRLGVGIGWNPIEFEALNENFKDRGRRSEEQIEFMRALWAEPHVTYEGQWHRINDAGINPLPPGGSIPLWLGGHVEATIERAGRIADGWIMLVYPPGEEALAAFARLRSYTEAAGRDPAAMGIEVWVSVGKGDASDWRREFEFWREAGVSHITLNNAYARYGHQRMSGRTLDDHLRGMEQYWRAIEDLR